MSTPTGARNRTRLDPLDRALLASIIRQPAAQYSVWAAENGMSARTVARRFEQFKRRGVVRVIGRTLPGFGGRVAWLARMFSAPERLGPLAAELAGLENTRWVRMSSDGGELICGVATIPTEHDPALHRMYATVPARDVHVHQFLKVWGPGHTVTTGAEELTELDRALLAAYARDGRTTSAQLATELNVDPATVSRRRRRLIDSGVLFFEADVRPDLLTESGDFNLWIRVRPGHISALGDHLRACTETRYVGAVSGEHQIFANVVLPSAGDALEFVDSLAEVPAGSGIVDFELVPMGHALKRSPS